MDLVENNRIDFYQKEDFIQHFEMFRTSLKDSTLDNVFEIFYRPGLTQIHSSQTLRFPFNAKHEE